MSPPAALTEAQALIAIGVLAAFADGDKHDRERAEVRRIAERLAQDEAIHLPSLVQDVLTQRLTLADATAALRGGAARQLAYEVAVGVCDADGAVSDTERRFLDSLRDALGLGPAADATLQEAEAYASAPLGSGERLFAGNAERTPAPDAGAPVRASRVGEEELDQAILNAAILNGALELLPETLSTLAIIPLQMKLVYRIGEAHGYELDSGHVKDFLATVGVGLTSQVLEQSGRRLLGGLLSRVGGGLLGQLGRQAVSSGMSFASTYALGHMAKRYYRGGRTLSTDLLRDGYQAIAQQAQGLQERYLPAMHAQARQLDARRVMQLLRGG